jgi:hypothetical protein
MSAISENLYPVLYPVASALVGDPCPHWRHDAGDVLYPEGSTSSTEAGYGPRCAEPLATVAPCEP